jgi:hypothetical protein
MENLAYDDASHGFHFGVVNAPNSWVSGTATPEVYAGNGLPYVGPAGTPRDIDCTTCHKVHNNDYIPFSMKGTSVNGFDVTPLCVTCHVGRINPGSVGSANNTGIGGLSTHPIGVTVADIPGNGQTLFVPVDARLSRVATVENYTLGGKRLDATPGGPIGCQTCHAVHGDEVTGTVPYDNLLAIPNVGAHASGGSSTLCTGCHGNPYGAPPGTVGNGSDHPMDGNSGWAFYPSVNPADWAGANGIPASWAAAGHFDAGATPIDVAASGQPACSSCHDVHGGLPATSLLYGPNTQGAGDWCFCCHSAATLVPAYHHSVQGNYVQSVIFCGDCHGTAGATSDTWSAHNGFNGFRVALSANDSSFCESCHSPLNPVNLAPAGADFAAPVYPAHHGPAIPGLGTDSHPVNTSTPALVNLLKYTGNWAGLADGPYDVVNANHPAGVTSKWGLAQEIRCESCHNILENVGNRVTTPSREEGGWKANLLLLGYEDDTAGVGVGENPDFMPAASSGDRFCRVCHNFDGNSDGRGDGLGGYVHYPAAHTIESTAFIYGAGETPYGRPINTILTDGNAACPNRSTADAPGTPGTFSYPAQNRVDCDSCHRPHNGWSSSIGNGGGFTGHIIVQDASAAFSPKTTTCDVCHSIDIMCGY